MNWLDLITRLDKGQDILLMTHEKPDGDAWGSVLGLGLVLEGLGFAPRFAHASLTPSKLYSWMPGLHLVYRAAREGFTVPAGAVVLVLDCGDLNRCEFALSPAQVLLNVDHHISNPAFGAVNWLDFGAGATAQILYSVMQPSGVSISKDAATCFYTALAADTGGFRFSNSSSGTLRAAADLIDLGADLELIRTHLWENRPRQELPLLREMMQSMQVFADGRGVLCALPYDVIQSAEIQEAETDTALEAIRGVEGVEAVVLLKEAEPGKVKVSLRSKNYLDSAACMASIGGGGHLRAAGATLGESLASARDKLLRLLEDALIV